MANLYDITTLSALIEYKAKNPHKTISLKGLEDIRSDEQLAIIRELMSSSLISYDLDDLATYSDLLLSSDPNQFLIQVASAYVKYSDAKQRQIEIDLINESLDRGASVMAILESYKDDLEILNHFQNKILRNKNTADQFLVRVISTHTYTEAEKEIQAKLAGAAIDKGAKIESALSNPSLRLSIAVLDNLQSVLLTENTADQFLVRVISEYTYAEAGKEMQAKLINAAIDKGAEIEFALSNFGLNIKVLDDLQSVLLTENTADQFLVRVISTYTYTEAGKEIQAKLAGAAIDKGAEIESALSNSFGLNIKVLDDLQSVLLTENTADQFLSKVILAYANTEAEKEIQAKLINAATDKGAKIKLCYLEYGNVNLNSISQIQDKILDPTFSELDPTESLTIILNSLSATTHPTISQESQLNLIDLCVKHGANIDKALSNVSAHGFLQDGVFTYKLLPDFIIDHLINNGLTKEYALIYYIERDNYQYIESGSLQGLSLKLDTNNVQMLEPIYRFDFSTSAKILKFFHNIDLTSINNILRPKGISHSVIDSIFNFIKFVQEYANISDDRSSSLTDIEINLLNEDLPCLALEQYKNCVPLNNYGYSVLHLAIISGKYDLALQLLQEGYSIDTTTLIILSRKDTNGATQELLNLANYIINNSNNLDLHLNESGETLVDNFISNTDLRALVLEKSNDKIYSFLKQDKDCQILTYNDSKTNIAITHTESFWSTGLTATARKAMASNPNLQFYTISIQDIEECGSDILNYIDAFMNPGASDNFPKGKNVFTIQNVPINKDPEKSYQEILSLTYDNDIPYFGICAGAQNFILHHQGSLYPLSGYNMGKHTINLVSGSMVHFMSLTKAEQDEALSSCVFPIVTYKGDTAHHFAATMYDLGNGIKIGGTSEDNVAMAYAHSNGIRFATQYHPEHFYHESNEIGRQKILLDNFFKTATMHHDYRLEPELFMHPSVVMQQVQDKLSQCTDKKYLLEYKNEYCMYTNISISDDLQKSQTILIGSDMDNH